MIKGKAHAKINLFLHVTGKRSNNYHDLESMVVFASDLYDQITVYPATELTLEVTGAFANELGQVSEHNNIIIKAALAIQPKGRAARIELVKNIPLAAGLGGGSADAALTLKLLCKLWQVTFPTDIIQSLGADVPICYHNQPAYFSGMGEQITPIKHMPELWAVLVNPHQAVSTASVFNQVMPPYHKKLADLPLSFNNISELIGFLSQQQNDLQQICTTHLPQLTAILASIAATYGCLLSRMSGSGPTCFGLFADATSANLAQAELKNNMPNYLIILTKL